MRKAPSSKSFPVRYAISDDALVCFGDTQLKSLKVGDNVRCTVHEIACGPPIASVTCIARHVEGQDLTTATVAVIHGNAPDPGPPGVNTYDQLRHTRRFISLQPI